MKVPKMGDLVAEGIDQARVLERTTGARVTQPDPNLAVRVADAVAASNVGTFCVKASQRKPEHLLRVLADHCLVPENTAYVGDSEDDEGCFAIVGYPIVAFLAPDDLKQQYAQDYNAFVPKDERELTSYLRLG